jgi:hypothetical protein
VRDELDLSASDNLMAPSVPSLSPVLSENEMKQQVLLMRQTDARDEFNWSASDSLVAPSPLTSLSVLSENQTRQYVTTAEIE